MVKLSDGKKALVGEVASSILRREHLGRRTKENFGLPAAAVRLFHRTEEKSLENLYSDEVPSFDLEPTARGEVMGAFEHQSSNMAVPECGWTSSWIFEKIFREKVICLWSSY